MWQHYCLIKNLLKNDSDGAEDTLDDDPDWTDDSPYHEPDVPEGTAFLLLAAPGYPAPWGVYACDLPDDRPLPPAATLVSEQLEGLIYSGEKYPPALALARAAIEDACRGRNIAPDTFLKMYAMLLRGYLRAQPGSGYLLVEAVHSQAGTMNPGWFYWLVGYNGNNEVQWVSSDFHVYTNPVSFFRIERQSVAHLSWIQRGRARSS